MVDTGKTMKLSDMKAVQDLARIIADCDFHLPYLEFARLRIWDGDRGAIIETYGDRRKYLSEAAEEEINAIVLREVKARRAEAVAALEALGVSA